MCVQVLTDSLNAVVFRVPLAHVTHVRYTGNQPFPQVSAARPCHDETEGFVFNERRFRICPEFTLINVSDDTHFCATTRAMSCVYCIVVCCTVSCGSVLSTTRRAGQHCRFGGRSMKLLRIDKFWI